MKKTNSLPALTQIVQSSTLADLILQQARDLQVLSAVLDRLLELFEHLIGVAQIAAGLRFADQIVVGLRQFQV